MSPSVSSASLFKLFGSLTLLGLLGILGDVGRLAAAVNNLSGEKYYDYAVRSAFTPDRYSVYPLPGRTFSLAAELLLR